MLDRKSFMVLAALTSCILICGFSVRSLSTRGTPLTSRETFGTRNAPGAQPPLCGRPNDGQDHIPPNWTSFVPPGVGQSYVDPVYGCSVKRLTNSSEEEALEGGKHPSLMHFYSTLSPLNAKDTMLLIISINGAWRVKDANGALVVPAAKM